MELEGNEEEKLQPNKNKVKTDSLSNSKTRDYALYKTFWNIQVLFFCFFISISDNIKKIIYLKIIYQLSLHLLLIQKHLIQKMHGQLF